MDNIYTFEAESLQMVLESFRKCGPTHGQLSLHYETHYLGEYLKIGVLLGPACHILAKYYHEACMGMTLSYVRACCIQSTYFQYQIQIQLGIFCNLNKGSEWLIEV